MILSAGLAALGPDAEASLKAVGRMMATAEDDWCLIGGAAAALHGVIAPLADIDVLMSVADARRLLARHGIAPTFDSGSEWFRSEVFCRWDGLAVPVDFMAGFGVRSQGDWVPVAPTPGERVFIGDEQLWLPAVNDLISMYELFDRPRDHARIAGLVALLT